MKIENSKKEVRPVAAAQARVLTPAQLKAVGGGFPSGTLSDEPQKKR